MNAAQYQPGGAQWSKVQAIISACSCSRLRAVSALKACRNDEAAAIESLNDVVLITTTSINSLSLGPSINDGVQAGGDRGHKTAANISVGPVELGSDDGLDRGSSGNQGRRSVSETSGGDERLWSSKIDDASTYDTSFKRDAWANDVPNCVVVNGDDAKYPEPSAGPNGIPNKSGFAFGIKSREGSDRAPANNPIPISQPVRKSSSTSTRQWDFRLPTVELAKSEPAFSPEEGMTQEFSIERLVSALQGGIPRGKLQHYLSFFSESVVARNMNAVVAGFPAIFYAVATNDHKIVRTWVNNGGEVNSVGNIYGIPLLAFAILISDSLGKDTTAVTTTLLSLGADVSVIPRVFFTPYLDDPPTKAPFNHRYREFDEVNKQWCSDYMRPLLARNVNLTQRYFLDKTFRDKRPSDRQLQVALTHNATSLLGISYFMIGQTSAAKTVTQKLLAHMALPRSKPLVMAFAGPSGHGKTELAKRMGELLSLELECIDCTELRYETDLFGPKKPYIGHELGSPLNNFLTRLTGRRCIVFLDEFEKTTRDVQNALLIPFDEGKYTDRRNRQPVDCSKTIWIIATNALDDVILDFCDINQDQVFETEDQPRHSELMTDLSGRLKKQLKSTFGNPLSGRVSIVLPFLPFSEGEQAVVAHKYVLELQNKVLQSVQVSGSQLVGRIILDVKQDGAICRLIASEGYDPDQGARSLKAAVEARIEDELVQKYLEEDGHITDFQPVARYTVDLARNGMLSVFKSRR